METILVNVEGHVATITINRPKALNALSTQVLTELDQALDEVAANKDVYALVITGAGEKAFVAGADIAGMKDKDVKEVNLETQYSVRSKLSVAQLSLLSMALH